MTSHPTYSARNDDRAPPPPPVPREVLLAAEQRRLAWLQGQLPQLQDRPAFAARCAASIAVCEQRIARMQQP